VENQELEQLKSEVKKQLLTFMQSPKCLESLEIINREIISFFDYGKDDVDILLDIATDKTTTKRETTTISILIFLWTYESYYALCVDLFCHLLTVCGHDLFDSNSNKRKYAVSFEDIGNVGIYTKLHFLKEHNFGMFERKKDRTLRNKIAHHDFSLDNLGALKVEGMEINIFQRQRALMKFTSRVMKAFMECLIESQIQNRPKTTPPNSFKS
jgi:hypothetical protein